MEDINGILILAFLGVVGALLGLYHWWHRLDGVGKEPAKKTICVDFDGVLHSYTSPWVNPWTIPDPPVDGAISFIFKLLCANYNVVICSCRANSWRGRMAIRAWLREHSGNLWCDTMAPGFCDIRVTAKKPQAVVYVDDRALRFKGVWPTVQTLKDLQPWNRPTDRA